MGLTLSFTTISAFRFLFDGCLPNQEGKQEECGPGFPEEYFYHHTSVQKFLLLFLAVAFGLVVFVMRSKWPEWLEPEEIKKQPRSERGTLMLLSRLAEGVYVSTSMCFSWSFFYGGQMIFAG